MSDVDNSTQGFPASIVVFRLMESVVIAALWKNSMSDSRDGTRGFPASIVVFRLMESVVVAALRNDIILAKNRNFQV